MSSVQKIVQLDLLGDLIQEQKGSSVALPPCSGSRRENQFGKRVSSLGAQPPKGYKLTTEGIYQKIEDKVGNIEWSLLCSPIRVLSLSRGADGKGWGRLVEIRDPDGNWHRWAVPAEFFAGEGLELRREAMRLGLTFGAGNVAKAIFSDMLQKWMPEARATTTDRLGWVDDTCASFVLGTGEVIGGGDVVFQSEHLSGAAAEMHSKGTLENWKGNVSGLCAGNPLAVISLSLAFAGPLLEPLRHEGGGIHLRGESSCGKSTILRAGVSVWGSSRFMQSWRATSNGLEGVATSCNSTLVALDEMSEVSATDAGGAVYMLANGTGKARASRSGIIRPVARWRTTILSSGELSLADKLTEVGQRKRAGQDVRLIDIQADSWSHGAFDDLHGEKDGAAFAERLNMAAAQAYGTAGPAFVAGMLEDMAAATEMTRHLSQGFARDAIDELAPDADGQVKRVFDRIGLAVAAGEMATAFGITGWQEGEATTAGYEVARMWLATRGGTGSQEAKDAVDRTRAFIVAHGESRFVDLDVNESSRARTIDRSGWKHKDHFYIAVDAWKKIHAGASPDNAARALRDAGFLAQESPDRLKKKAPSNVLGRPRCYCIGVEIMGGSDG